MVYFDRMENHALLIPPCFIQIELNIRLTELGNKFGDVDTDVKALQTAEQGKLTTCTLHDYMPVCTIYIE